MNFENVIALLLLIAAFIFLGYVLFLIFETQQPIIQANNLCIQAGCDYGRLEEDKGLLCYKTHQDCIKGTSLCVEDETLCKSYPFNEVKR